MRLKRPTKAAARTGTALVLIVGMGSLVIGPATRGLAQTAEADGGVRLDAGLNLRLEMDNGTPEFRTGFNLDLISATRIQQLSFSGDFGITVPLENIDDTSFSDPGYGVSYVRDNGLSRIVLNGFYQQSDVDGTALLLDDPDTVFDETNLVEDDGTRETRRLSGSVEVGQEAPFGATLRFSSAETIYADTSDPDLVDDLRREVEGIFRFDLDRTLQVTVNAEWSLNEEQDLLNTTEERRLLGVGWDWMISPDLTVNGNLTYAETLTDTTTGGVTTTTEDSGVNVMGGATLDRPNGSYRFDYSRLLDTPGFVNTIELSRNFSLGNGAEIRAGVGVVAFPSGETVGIGSLSYSRDVPRGTLSGSIGRSATLNGDNDEVVRTTLRARYSGDLSPTSSWSLSGAVIDSDFIIPTTADVTAAEMSLRYNLALTEDWGLSTGVTYRETREDGSADSNRSTVFVSLERTFSFRR